MTNAEARFSNSLRPRKPEGSLGRTAQDVHLDSHTAPELSPTTCRSWLYGSPFVTSPVSHFTPTGRQSGSDDVPNNLSFLALWFSLCYLPCQSLHTHRSSERLRQRPQQLVVPGFMSAPLSPRTVGVALWRKWAGVIDPRTVPHPRLHPRRV